MRYCLWGGNASWVQVGSLADRRLQRNLRMAATMTRFGAAMSQAVAATEHAAQAFKALGEAVEHSRLW